MLQPLEGQVDEAQQVLARAFAPLEAAGCAALAAEGFAGGDTALLEHGLDVRYQGQSFELSVPLEGMDLRRALSAFHVAHEVRYGYARPGAAVEIVNVRLTARGLRPKLSFPPAPPAAGSDPAVALVDRRPIHLHGRWMEAPVYRAGC